MSGSLHDAFIDELRDTFDAEKQITRALPRVAKAATSPELRAAFEQHIQETKAQVERLTRVFESLGEKPRGKHCDGMAGILEEARSALEEDTEDATMDALLIASAQRVEHYEMAAYGTLVAWAEAMGHDEAARLLRETLDEEKATDEKLTTIAEGSVNRQAASQGQDAGQEDEEDEAPQVTSRQARGRTGGRATGAAKAASGRAGAGSSKTSKANGSARAASRGGSGRTASSAASTRSASARTTGARKR